MHTILHLIGFPVKGMTKWETDIFLQTFPYKYYFYQYRWVRRGYMLCAIKRRQKPFTYKFSKSDVTIGGSSSWTLNVQTKDYQ